MPETGLGPPLTLDVIYAQDLYYICLFFIFSKLMNNPHSVLVVLVIVDFLLRVVEFAFISILV